MVFLFVQKIELFCLFVRFIKFIIVTAENRLSIMLSALPVEYSRSHVFV